MKRTDNRSAAGGRIVRTAPANDAYAGAADKRFEIRLTSAQLARWRTIAAERGVSLAELVRAAVEFAASHMPVDYVANARAELVRTTAETIDRVRTACDVFDQHGEPLVSGSIADVPGDVQTAVSDGGEDADADRELAMGRVATDGWGNWW